MSSGFTDYYGGLAIPLPVLQGGTGRTSFPVNSVPYSQDATTFGASNVGNPGDILGIPQAGGAPQFGPVPTQAVDLVNKTASVASTTLVASANQRVYRLSAEIFLHNPVAGAISASVSITWTQNGIGFVQDLTSLSQSNGNAVSSGLYHIYPDAGTIIKYSTGYTGSGGSGDYYDAHIRVEKLG